MRLRPKIATWSQALLATHYHHEATITALLTPHSSSPSADLKPGKAPKGVDYIGRHPRATMAALALALQCQALRVQCDAPDMHAPQPARMRPVSMHQ